jgi:YVTN family beta-propeller protein
MIVRKIATLAAATCALAYAQTAQNIATGRQPMAIAVNEATNRAYIVNHNSGSVTVVDGSTHAVSATVKVGSGPEAAAVNPQTNRVYVANSGESSVTVIDGSTGAVLATVRTGSNCNAIAVNPATNKI